MGRQTRRIQKPLIQNRGHVKALREFLDFDGSAFIPVVWMISDARMKEPVPAGVLRGGDKKAEELEPNQSGGPAWQRAGDRLWIG